MADLATLTGATAPLTLARVASGFAPLLAADLARATAMGGGRLLWIASDDAAMQAMTDTAAWFAPETGSDPLPRVGLPTLRPRRA